MSKGDEENVTTMLLRSRQELLLWRTVNHYKKQLQSDTNRQLAPHNAHKFYVIHNYTDIRY